MPHDPEEQRPVTNITACNRCGLPLMDGICVACRNARAARWYSENTDRHNAESTVRQRVKRWFPGPTLSSLQQAMESAQGGVCACCGLPSRTRMGIDWSLDQEADDGCPLTRGVVCRSCKIAINRYVHPSKYVLMPAVTERVERYLERAWFDPRQLHRGSGGKAGGRRTDDLIEWLSQVAR